MREQGIRNALTTREINLSHPMKRKFLQGGTLLLLLATFCLFLPLDARAQSSAPKLKMLNVALWPEYDRPEVLVIYRTRLSAGTELPTRVTFRLPGYIEQMHAVAVERDGVLVDVNQDSIELIHNGDDLLLTFPSSSLNLQFEYYDPFILAKQNQTRQLAFDFSAPYEIEMTIFEVQQPFQAEEFTLLPEPVNSFTNSDGLRHYTIEVPDLAPGDTFKLSATYRRNTDEVSVQSIKSHTPSQRLDISVVTEPSRSRIFDAGYIFIGAGVILLLVIGGYLWFRQTRAETEPYSMSEENSTFCYRCGTALQKDANFCHNCGAERHKN